MAVRHHVQGYDDFFKFMAEMKVDGPVYVLYTGTKLENGHSWCPDCVEAEPFIDKAFQSLSDNTHLVVNEVGDRSFWKDTQCPYRTNSKTKLKVLPTLAKWGTQKRLEGDHCTKPELLDMLLNDDDD